MLRQQLVKIIIACVIIFIGQALAQRNVRSSNISESYLQSFANRSPNSDQYVPGIYYEYFYGQWFRLPDFDQEKVIAVGVVSNFDIDPRLQDDFFGFRFFGYIKIDEGGTYKFYLKSDDGSRLYINGEEIVDNDNIRSALEASGSVSLDVGWHSISVLYFQRQGREKLDVKYSGPSIKKQHIPDDVLFRQQLSGFPMLWQHQDIGRPSEDGSAFYHDGVFTIKASGDDIWDDEDEFHFLYWPLTGDAEIIAKVNSITNTDNWAKSGAMIRETLSDDSKHASMFVTQSSGTAFQRRILKKKESFHSGSSGAVPIWLKLVRIGDIFTGYKSSDSLNWEAVGSDKIEMNEQVNVGIALTSHDDDRICTSEVKVWLGGGYRDFELYSEPAVVAADDKSISRITSSPILDFKHSELTAGTEITVSTDNGKIASPDINEQMPGVQVTTDNSGCVRFDYQAGIEPGAATVFAKSVFGDATGEATIELVGEYLELISTKSTLSNVTQGQQNIPVSLIIRNDGFMTSTIQQADLVMSGLSAVSERINFDVVRTDTITKISPQQVGELTFLVSVTQDADLLSYRIDGRVVTEIGSYSNCKTKHQWQVQSPPDLKIVAIDAFADEIYQGQQGLIVTLDVLNEGTASVDSLNAALKFWRQGVDINHQYQVTISDDSPVIVNGQSQETIMFLVDVAVDATVDTIGVSGGFSARDINTGIRYQAAGAELRDQWLIKRAEGIVFDEIRVSTKYATSGQQLPWYMRLKVRNVTGVDLAMDSVRVRFHVFNDDVTAEYNLVYPDNFLGSHTNFLDSEQEDSLHIAVTGFGSTMGLLEITAHIYCHELTQYFIVTDSSPDGLGYVFVYGLPELEISTAIDSCYHYSESGDGIVNTGQNFSVKVTVRNIGDEDLKNIGLSVLGNGESVPTTVPSQLLPTVLKNQSANLFFGFTAEAALTPTVEYFNTIIDSAIGAKSGESASINPLSDTEARITIYKPAELSLTADSVKQTPVDNIFQINALVINPSGHAQCDSSGELTIVLPEGYQLFDDRRTKNFDPNKKVSWQVRAPNSARDSDSILVYISRQPDDLNALSPAMVNSDSAVIQVSTLRSYVDIEQSAIIAPAGATDNVLSTRQKFFLGAIITSQMAENITVNLQMPPNYSMLNSNISGKDTLYYSWQIKAPATPHYQPEIIVIQAHGSILNDTTTVNSKPDSSLSVVTVDRAQLEVAAEIIEPPKAVEGYIQPDFEFKIKGLLQNRGDATVRGDISLKLEIEDREYFTIIGDPVVPLKDDAAYWVVRTSTELPADNWVLKVRLHDIPVDVNTDSVAHVEREYKDLALTSSRGVGRLELMIQKMPHVGPTSVSAGESEILLGLTFTNLATERDIPIILNAVRFDTRDEYQHLIYPDQLIGNIRIRRSNGVILGENSEIVQNPVMITFSVPDTIETQQTDSLFVEIDLHENLNHRFMLHLKDSSYVEATSFVDVYIVNEAGNSHGRLNINSHCPVIVKKTLAESFGCYPNPFGNSERPTTNFVYYLSEAANVELKIFTLLGELVWTRSYKSDEPQGQRGLHSDDEIEWDGCNLNGHKVLNGVYIAWIRTEYGKSATTKVAVLK